MGSVGELMDEVGPLGGSTSKVSSLTSLDVSLATQGHSDSLVGALAAVEMPRLPLDQGRKYYRPGENNGEGIVGRDRGDGSKKDDNGSGGTKERSGNASYHSLVWDYFLLYDEERSGVTRTFAQCTVCQNSIQYTRNTSNMLRHLAGTHPDLYRAAKAESDSTKALVKQGKRRATQLATSLVHVQQVHNQQTEAVEAVVSRATAPLGMPPSKLSRQTNTYTPHGVSPGRNPLCASNMASGLLPISSTPAAAWSTVPMSGGIAVGKPDDWVIPTRPLMNGLCNEFESEAVPGALPPRGRNNPQHCSYGLCAEQLSGSPFTTPRTSSHNLRTWLYRRTASAGSHGPFTKAAPGVGDGMVGWRFQPSQTTPERMRWQPLPFPPHGEIDFVDGLITVAGAGDPAARTGLRVYLYAINASMNRRCFYSADGDILIVPQQGTLIFKTEMGRFQCSPGSVAVIPQGIKYAVGITEENARGYCLEVFGGHFELPDLGIIGANGLASARDFQVPSAFFEDALPDFDSTRAPQDKATERPRYEMVTKFGGEIFTASMSESPFDVLAWHGNYVPFTYDLSLFVPVNSVRVDHMDPSIFTVLTCRGTMTPPGMALADFVIFPPRWSVGEDTFRPPYFHRNCMTEFMGVIRGQYDAKDSGSFGPGCSSLHPMMSAHGPDAASYAKAMANTDQSPSRISDEDLAFMFETSLVLKMTPWALESDSRDLDYTSCWNDMPTVPLGS